MDLLIIMTYTGLCIAIFKIFRIPLNKWTVPTAILGGVFILAALLLVMNYNHPYTKMGREFYVTVPIVPAVSGIVVDVPVAVNAPLKEGDVLFQIDPVPYQQEVDRKRAQFAEAEPETGQLRAALDSARAAVAQAQAQATRTADNLARAEELEKTAGDNSPISKQELESRRQLTAAAAAALDGAIARENSAKLAYEAQVGGLSPTVARMKAELEAAEYDLARTTVRAPTDGYVTQMRLRPGVMAASLPLRPVMTFIPDEGHYFAGAFWQNSMLRLKPGYEAEVLLDAVPGRVFKAHIDRVLPALGEGELQSSGTLARTDAFKGNSRPVVIVKFEDDLSEYNLPAGVQGEIAVYSDHFHHVAIIRKILLRMKSWQNYLFGEGH